MPARKSKRTGRGRSVHDEVMEQAKSAIEANRFDEAESLARSILARKQDHRGAMHVAGVALLARGKAVEALSFLNSAVQDGPDPVIETHLAMALKQADRATEALTWLERAITRQPPFQAAFHELGLLLDSLNRFDDAETVLRQGLKIFPGSADAWIALGRVLIMRGDRSGAQLAFARALAEAPGHPNALFGHACVLRDDADFSRAADLFRHALRQIPDWADAKLQLGYCLLELDRWDDAIASIRAAIALDPSLFDKARHVLVRSGRGRFWLRPSAVAKVLGRVEEG